MVASLRHRSNGVDFNTSLWLRRSCLKCFKVFVYVYVVRIIFIWLLTKMSNPSVRHEIETLFSFTVAKKSRTS